MTTSETEPQPLFAALDIASGMVLTECKPPYFGMICSLTPGYRAGLKSFGSSTEYPFRTIGPWVFPADEALILARSAV